MIIVCWCSLSATDVSFHWPNCMQTWTTRIILLHNLTSQEHRNSPDLALPTGVVDSWTSGPTIIITIPRIIQNVGPQHQWRSYWGGKGGQSATPDREKFAQNRGKIRKNRGKIRKNRKKEEKSGRMTKIGKFLSLCPS